MKKTLNIGGRILDLSTPKIMGIVNLTPDSFYSESRSLEDFPSKIEKMIAEGADILDFGAYSTRPGADEITIQEEVDRLLPALEYAKLNYPNFPISIDTFRSKVVKEALKVNTYIVNDVSGGTLDDDMWDTIAQAQVPYILMHMRGNPKSMQQEEHITYESLTMEVFKLLQSKSRKLLEKGVKDIIIDPGIGFAKSVEGSFELVKNIGFFQSLHFPVLLGVSRKSFIYKTLGVGVGDSLNGTTIMHTFGLLNGVSILRVHDIGSAKEVKLLLNRLDLA